MGLKVKPTELLALKKEVKMAKIISKTRSKLKKVFELIDELWFKNVLCKISDF